MQRTILVAVVVVLVAFAGAGGTVAADTAATQDAEEVTVELVVTTPDGDPVGDAEATVEWDGGSESWSTSSNGRVYIDVPEGADASITLTHDEYLKNVPVELTDASGGQTVETEMHPPATGEITVVDADGSAVEGATVRLRKDGQSAYAARGDTDADGVYTSPEVESGTYTVSVRQPGYYHESTTADLEGESNATVEIEQGDATVDLLVQDPTPEGPGVVNATVEIRLDGEQVLSRTTSEQGRSPVVLDVNQNYDVTVTKGGYRELSTGLRTGETDSSATFNVTRSPSISLSADNERVVVGENLRVEVTDEYDRPVEGASVLVGGEDAGQTDGQGVARVEIPSEGDVEVTAEYDGQSTDPVTVTGITGSGGDDGAATNDTDDSGDGGTGDGSPGFGVVAALFGALAAVAALARRS